MTLENNIDFDAMPDDVREEVIANGGQIPESYKPADAPADEVVVDPPVVEEPVVEVPAEEVPEIEAPVEDPPVIEDPPADDPAARVANFAFTPDADAETRAKEEAEYLELVEIAEPVQQIIAHREARIAELEAQVTGGDADPVQVRHTEAFDGLVTFVQNEDGDYVSNTAPIRELLEEFYPKEQEQLMIDILSGASKKYAGNTVFQQILRDVKGLGEAEMQTLDTFLDNGGRMPFLKITPGGIDEKYAEAYWTDSDKDETDAKVQSANFVLSDPRATDEEKEVAQRSLDKINRTLGIVQKGVDADRAARQAEQQQQINLREQITAEGTQVYIQTTLGLLEQTRADLAKSLTMFDPETSEIVADAFSKLITDALSDVDAYAKDSQKQLADKGIKVDWAAASAAINRLYDSEQKIVALKKLGANPRAVEIELKNKSRILLDIKGLEKNLTGQIVAKLTTGAGKALKSQIAKAPNAGGKVPAVRPRIAGDAAQQTTNIDWDKMPINELNDVIFGRKTVPGVNS